MSGHSHYSTIKRTKEAKDAVKGRIFSRHAKAIAIAVKEGGSSDPTINAKLRDAINQAKSDNLPKSNIERLLNKAGEMGDLQEATYEGFAPGGIAVMVKVVTDNKNRTAQEIKNLFERVGGSLASPGAVSFNFKLKGLVVVKKEKNTDDQILKLIDLGAEDVEDTGSDIEVYVGPTKVGKTKEKIEKDGFEIVSFSQIQKPKNKVDITNPDVVNKVLMFLETLENHDDVQSVSANLNISPELIEKIK